MRPPWLTASAVIMAATVILELLFRHHGHAAFWWHVVPGFDLLFGLAGCVGLVLVAKWLGYTWVQRDEDYYGDEA